MSVAADCIYWRSYLGYCVANRAPDSRQQLMRFSFQVLIKFLFVFKLNIGAANAALYVVVSKFIEYSIVAVPAL